MRENINFCYKGNRNYVHGTDILNAVLNFFKNENIVETSNIEMDIHHIVSNNLTLVINEDLSSSEKAAVYVKLKRNEALTKIALIENKETISCRYEYSEEDIVKYAFIDKETKSISLIKYDKFTFIERVVALNKVLLQTLFPEVMGKWYFTKVKINSTNLDKQCFQKIELRLKKNFKFKLTQTEILADDKSIGNIYFSLV